MANRIFPLVLCVLATTTTTTTTTTLNTNGYNYNTPNGNRLSVDDRLSAGGQDALEELAALVPGGGVPGVDYPILFSIPETSFTCSGLVYGYYADPDPASQCQVFHVCPGEVNIGQRSRGGGQEGQGVSFLCPNGTIFSQEYLVCAWWYDVECDASEGFYGVNEAIGGVAGGDGGAAGVGGGVVGVAGGLQAPTQLYGAPN